MLLLLPVCFPAAFHPKRSSKKQTDTVSVSTLGGARTPSLLLEGKEGTTGQKGDQGGTEPHPPQGGTEPHPPTVVRTQMASHPEISIHSLKLKLKKHKPYIF